MIAPSKRRILLIDDQSAIHDDYRKIIGATSSANTHLSKAEAELFGGAALAEAESAESYDIDSAYSGEEAIAMVAKALEEGKPYAVAFVDIRMPPGIDGVHTMRRIWEIDSEILAVMCSAYSDYSWEEIVKELGRTDRFLILRKPFDTIEVRQCAAALTGRWAVARTDALTNLLNRRSFEEHLRREWALAVRNDRPLACIMIDIDEFRAVNDRYGHSIGDQVLKVLASVLANELRAGDVLCRYSGEQFCVLLPGADQAVAANWAESARITIAAQPLHVGGHRIALTASFGVVDRKSSWQQDLVERAEQALREAKAAGPCRVVVWTRASAPGQDEFDSELSRLAETFGHPAPACDDVQRILKYAILFENLTARDLMTTPIVCVPRGTPVAEAAGQLLARQVSSAPVVNPDGTLVGIVAERDIMETVGVSDGWSAPVERFMTEGVIQYEPNIPATVIFDFLCRVQIRRVVIVDAGRPVGTISRGTFLRWVQNHARKSGRSSATVIGGSPFGHSLRDEPGAAADELVGPIVADILSMQDAVADLTSWSRPPHAAAADVRDTDTKSAVVGG